MRFVKTTHSLEDDDIVLVTEASLADPFSRWMRRDWRAEDHARVAAQLLGSDDFFLDVGANYGVFSIPVAIATGASALCVEALQTNVPVLHEAIQANGLDERMDWMLAAITEESGEVRVAGESAYGTVGDAGKRVLSYSLDDLMDECDLGSVALVKMDIEGCELPALRGGSRFFDANPECVWVFEANAAHCWRTGSAPQDLLAFFEDRGYLLYLCQNDRLVRRTSAYFQESGVSDYIATPTPLEDRIRGFSYEPFDDAHRVAETVKALTQMKTGYKRSALAQMHLAPPSLVEAPEIAAILKNA